MNILVTGGAGFIGSHIVNTYIEAGHCVTVIDNLSSGRLQFLNPKAKFHEMDILDPKITDVIKSERIKVKKKVKGVYADMLGTMFKKYTGMNVSL